MMGAQLSSSMTRMRQSARTVSTVEELSYLALGGETCGAVFNVIGFAGLADSRIVACLATCQARVAFVCRVIIEIPI